MFCSGGASAVTWFQWNVITPNDLNFWVLRSKYPRFFYSLKNFIASSDCVLTKDAQNCEDNKTKSTKKTLDKRHICVDTYSAICMPSVRISNYRNITSFVERLVACSGACFDRWRVEKQKPSNIRWKFASQFGFFTCCGTGFSKNLITQHK